MSGNYAPLKSGDTIFIGATNSAYSADGSFYAATNIQGTGCGSLVDNCMAMGICHNRIYNQIAVQGALTLAEAQGEPTTKWTIRQLVDLGSRFVEATLGTPIRLGSYVSFEQDVNGVTYYWQTGPRIAAFKWNDTIQLTTKSPFDTDGDRYERVWIPVQTVPPFTGVFRGVPAAGNLGAYYGTAYWFQSLGKFINENNYQYATLNNFTYDCVLSTQDVSGTPEVGDLGPAFMFFDLQGNIPLAGGGIAPPPTPVASAHWYTKAFYVFLAVMALVIITFILVVFVMVLK